MTHVHALNIFLRHKNMIIISVIIYYSFAFIWGEETMWTMWKVLIQLVRSTLH